jgi:hypothetical protein
MSEEVSAESSQTGSESATESKEVVVNRSAEEYAIRVKELANENEKRKLKERKLKEELDGVQAKLKAIEDSKLQEQGQFKEAFEKAKKEAEDLKSQTKKMQATYAFKVVTSQVKEEAIKAGCVDADAFIKLASANGLLDNLEPDDDFNVKSEDVKAIVERAQKNMTYLFGKTAPSVKDGIPAAKVQGGNSLEKMTLQQKIEKLASMTGSKT